jgi:O-antigen/teichoic acid export membrane protein
LQGLSLRRNFAWIFAGNVVYFAVQWLLIVAVARVGAPAMVGQYALALALSAPVFMTVGLNLRVVRVTDVRRIWTPRQYSRLRVLSNLAAVAITLLVGVLVGLRGTAFLVLALVALSKSTEATSQVLYGYFQLRERLDLVSRSLLLRAALGAVGFVGVLLVTTELAAACAGLGAGWFTVYLLHDRPRYRKLLESEREAALHDGYDPDQHASTLKALAFKAAPLGVDAGVRSLATNVPRFGVQFLLGTAALGVFTALATLAQLVAMITGSFADSIVGRLAKLVSKDDRSGFLRLLGLLVGFGLGVALLASAATWLVGDFFVSLLLGSEYVNRTVLVLLMIGSGMITFQRSLSRGLQALHRYTGTLVVDCVTLGATVVLALVLIPAYGLPGAAITLGAGFGVGSCLALVLILRSAAAMGSGGHGRPHDEGTSYGVEKASPAPTE